jgi:hypothetical protein
MDCPGTFLWGDTLGVANGSEVVAATGCDSDNNVFVTGTYDATMTFGMDTLTASTDFDMFLVRYDPNGTPVWGKGFAGPGLQAGSAMTFDSQGNIVVSGRFANTIDLGGGSLDVGNGLNQFLAKFDVDANHIWSRSVADADDILSADIARDAEGNIYLAGRMEGTAEFDGEALESDGGLDAWIAKFDPLGEFLWAKRFGNFNDQEANSLAVSPEGFAVVGGVFTGSIQPGQDPISSEGGEDGFLVAFAPDGGHVWSFGIGSSGPSQRVAALGMRSDGDIIVAGQFDGLMSVGDTPLTSSNEVDVFLARVAR